MPTPFETISFKAPVGTRKRVLEKAIAHGLVPKRMGSPTLTDYYNMIEAQDKILEK